MEKTRENSIKEITSINILKNINDRIIKASQKARNSGFLKENQSVRLLGVSKTVNVKVIESFHKAGLNLFGENYVQEFLPKYETLRIHKDVEFHFIGSLQSNKVKYIIDKVSLIHGVEKESVIAEISKRVRNFENQGMANVACNSFLIQVNISSEESKSGVQPSELNSLIEAALKYKNLNLKGLMCIPREHDSESEMREEFSQMRNLLLKANEKFGINMTELSMGMSHDFEIAIEEGATIVRIGSLLFGERDYSMSTGKETSDGQNG